MSAEPYVVRDGVALAVAAERGGAKAPRVQAAVLRARADERLHAGAWSAWLLAGVVCVLMTSNPLYVATLGLCGLVVYAAWRRPERRALDGLLIVSTLFALLTLPLNLVTGSSGATVLFTLPEIVLPGWLASVRFGGDVTAESLVFAATRTAGLIAIAAFVCAFNAGVDHFKLLRLMPGRLAQAGIVLTVAVVLVPETLARAATLVEARKVRGYGGGVRTFVSLLVPLLADALDRSVQRAESLDARGYGRLAPEVRPRGTLLLTACVAGAAAAVFASYYVSEPSIALYGAGALGVAAIVMVAKQGGGAATQMRRQAFGPRDWTVLVCSVVAVVGFVALRQTGAGGLSYLPFPEIAVPAFEPVAAVLMLLLVAPALAGGQRGGQR